MSDEELQLSMLGPLRIYTALLGWGRTERSWEGAENWVPIASEINNNNIYETKFYVCRFYRSAYQQKDK